jgi:hypothetical protein
MTADGLIDGGAAGRGPGAECEVLAFDFVRGQR